MAAPVLSRAKPIILNPQLYQNTVEAFNRDDTELITNAVPNARAWPWMEENIPWRSSLHCGDC